VNSQQFDAVADDSELPIILAVRIRFNLSHTAWPRSS
jgi:hypothetical protein